MGYLKISNINVFRPDGQTFDLLLTSVKLSSFHINFKSGRPRTSQENSWRTIIS